MDRNRPAAELQALLAERERLSAALAPIEAELASRLAALPLEQPANLDSDLLEALAQCPDAHRGAGLIAAHAARLLPLSLGTVSLLEEADRSVIAAVWADGASGRYDLLEQLRAMALPAPLQLPLQAFDVTVGELRVWLRPDATEPAEFTAQVRQLAAVAALGLGGIQLKQRASVRSVRDNLTGLFNQRYLQDTLHRELHRAQRYQQELGLILLDLDRFTAFNQAHGHAAGNEVLRAVAGLVQASFRGSDVCARYDGQRFAILLPQAALSDTLRRARQLQELTAELGDGPHRVVSLSAGIAHYPLHADNADDLLAAAESALFLAKQQGCGGACCAERLESPELP